MIDEQVIDKELRELICLLNPPLRPKEIRGTLCPRDVGIDSLDTIDLAVEIENKYDILIEDRNMWNVQNFNGLFKMVIEKLEAKNGNIITN